MEPGSNVSLLVLKALFLALMVSMYLFTLILTSILFQLAKAEDDVSVAADSEAFVKRGNWTLITSLDSLGLGGSWLRYVS